MGAEILTTFMDNIINLPLYYKILLAIGVIIIVDLYSSLRYYYIDKAYRAAVRRLDLRRLKYLRDTVISGYKILAKEGDIEDGISSVRSLEEQLEVDPFDFTEHKLEYDKNINDVLKRGYF